MTLNLRTRLKIGARILGARTVLILLPLLMVFASPPAIAGGDFFTAKVLEFQEQGDGAYRLVLNQLTPLYASGNVHTNPIAIRLRHDGESGSRKEYATAIALLRQQIAQSATIRFGVMGGAGLARADGKLGEFQSNRLIIEDGIVYAWIEASAAL